MSAGVVVEGGSMLVAKVYKVVSAVGILNVGVWLALPGSRPPFPVTRIPPFVLDSGRQIGARHWRKEHGRCERRSPEID